MKHLKLLLLILCLQLSFSLTSNSQDTSLAEATYFTNSPQLISNLKVPSSLCVGEKKQITFDLDGSETSYSVSVRVSKLLADNSREIIFSNTGVPLTPDNEAKEELVPIQVDLELDSAPEDQLEIRLDIVLEKQLVKEVAVSFVELAHCSSTN